MCTVCFDSIHPTPSSNCSYPPSGLSLHVLFVVVVVLVTHLVQYHGCGAIHWNGSIRGSVLWMFSCILQFSLFRFYSKTLSFLIFFIVESTSGILEVLHKVDSEGVSQNHTSHAVSAATSGFVSRGNAWSPPTDSSSPLPPFRLSFGDGHSVICHGENQLCVLRNHLLLFGIRLSLT